MSVEIEVEVKCSECGRRLDAEVRKGEIYVELCSNCIDKVEQEQHHLGYDDGYEERKGEEKL